MLRRPPNRGSPWPFHSGKQAVEVFYAARSQHVEPCIAGNECSRAAVALIIDQVSERDGPVYRPGGVGVGTEAASPNVRQQRDPRVPAHCKPRPPGQASHADQSLAARNHEQQVPAIPIAELGNVTPDPPNRARLTAR